MGASGALKRKIQKNNAPEAAPQPEQQGGGIGGTAMQMADPEQSGQMDAGKMKQVEDLTAMYLNLIHSEETRESVMEALAAQDNPVDAVSATANMIMARVDAGAQKRKMEIPNEAKVAAAQYLVVDLINLGNVSESFEYPLPEEEAINVFRKTVQDYIGKGLRDKTIDPVQLQLDIESLMTDEQKQGAQEIGQQAGANLPPGPTPQMAVDRQVQGKVDAEKAKTATFQREAQALKGAMRGGQQNG